jgi:hypothetical protein
MANARPTARPAPRAHVMRRHGHAVAPSLAGALAGLVAGTACGVWAPDVGRGGASASPPPIASSKGGGPQQGSARSGVAAVLLPAPDAGIERTHGLGGEDGPP